MLAFVPLNFLRQDLTSVAQASFTAVIFQPLALRGWDYKNTRLELAYSVRGLVYYYHGRKHGMLET